MSTDPITILEEWRQGDEYRKWVISSPAVGQQAYMVDLFVLPDVWYADDADLLTAVRKAVRGATGAAGTEQ